MIDEILVERLRYRVDNYTGHYSTSDRDLDKLILAEIHRDRRAPPDLEGVVGTLRKALLDLPDDILWYLDEMDDEEARELANAVRRARAALASLPNSPGGVGDGWCYDMDKAPKDGMPLMLFARSKNATASVRLIGWYLQDLGWIEAAFSPNHPVGIIPQAWQHLPDFPNRAAPIAEDGK